MKQILLIDTIYVYTSMSVIAHVILNYNKIFVIIVLKSDGISITFSHHPPEHEGIKYNSFCCIAANIDITDIN